MKKIILSLILFYFSYGSASDLIVENPKTIHSNRLLEIQQIGVTLNVIKNKIKPKTKSLLDLLEVAFKSQNLDNQDLCIKMIDQKKKLLGGIQECLSSHVYTIFSEPCQEHQQMLRDQKTHQTLKETLTSFVNNFHPVDNNKSIASEAGKVDLFSIYLDYQMVNLWFYQKALEDLLNEK